MNLNSLIFYNGENFITIGVTQFKSNFQFKLVTATAT